MTKSSPKLIKRLILKIIFSKTIILKVEKGDEIEIPFDFSQAFGTVKKKKSVKNRVKEKEPTILDRPFTKVIHILDVELEGNDENNKTADDKTYLIKARIWDEHDGKDEVDEDDD